MTPELRQKLSMRNPVHVLALGFGSGLLPKMPGTYGSLAAIPLVILLVQQPSLYGLATVLACVAGIFICARTARDMGVHDHGAIVWDEIAGMLVCFIGISITPVSLLLGFVLFRCFDIVKPWPISFVDKHTKGGLGIMLDDILAGALTCMCLHWLF